MKKLTFLAAICLMFAASLHAHTITPVQLKQARMAAYQWVRDYNVYARMEGKREPAKKFIALFEEESTMVFNDYLPVISTQGNKLSVKAYASILANREPIYKMSFEITNATIVSEEIDENGNIVFSMEFDKTVSFQENGNTSDELYAYPKKSYRAIVQITYDMQEEKAIASEITSNEDFNEILVLHDIEAELVNQYTTRTKLENLCKNNGSSLVKWNFASTEFDSQMMCLYQDTLKNSVHLGGSVGYSTYSSKILNDSFEGYALQSGFAWAISFGYYRQLLLKDKNRFGIDCSLAFSQKNIGFKADAYNESYNTIDPDDGNYLRLIEVSAYQERIKRYAIEIPIDFRYDYFIKDNLSIYSKLGVYVSYDIVQRANATAHAQYSGYYDWLFNVTISQNGIYDFGAFDVAEKSTNTGINHFGAGIFAGVGVQYFIPKSKWSIDAAIVYGCEVYNKITKVDGFHLTEHSADLKSASYLFKSFKGHNIQLQVNLNYNF